MHNNIPCLPLSAHGSDSELDTMATSQILLPPETGFPKYSELPMELRLQIIELAVEAYDPYDDPRSLAQFAGINSEWNRIIERILFKAIRIDNKDLVEFGSICAKRQSLLKKIHLTIYLSDSSVSASPIPKEFFVDCLSQLFHMMKGWRREDMRPHHLIKLCISLISNAGSQSSFSCNFENLPEVQAIGSVQRNQMWHHDSALDTSTMQSLYGKFPNLYHANLDLTHQGSLEEMIHDTSSKYKYPFHNMVIGNMLTGIS